MSPDNSHATKDAMIGAARALRPLLDSFHGVSGLILRSVYRIYADESIAGSILQFDDVELHIDANGDADTIEVFVEHDQHSARKNAVDGSTSLPWRDVIGQPFGWGWLTINQQGYCDGVLLSFHGITPQIFLSVVASSLKESVIRQQF